MRRTQRKPFYLAVLVVFAVSLFGFGLSELGVLLEKRAGGITVEKYNPPLWFFRRRNDQPDPDQHAAE